jgi:hypothetical protein
MIGNRLDDNVAYLQVYACRYELYMFCWIDNHIGINDQKCRHYQAALANADEKRMNDCDGRGYLSQRYLGAFCQFFLGTAVDQVEFGTLRDDRAAATPNPLCPIVGNRSALRANLCRAVPACLGHPRRSGRQNRG